MLWLNKDGVKLKFRCRRVQNFNVCRKVKVSTNGNRSGERAKQGEGQTQISVPFARESGRDDFYRLLYRVKNPSEGRRVAKGVAVPSREVVSHLLTVTLYLKTPRDLSSDLERSTFKR